jgi:hypothetical protein
MKRARGPRGGRKQRRQQGSQAGAEGDEAMHDVEVRLCPGLAVLTDD